MAWQQCDRSPWPSAGCGWLSPAYRCDAGGEAAGLLVLAAGFERAAAGWAGAVAELLAFGECLALGTVAFVAGGVDEAEVAAAGCVAELQPLAFEHGLAADGAVPEHLRAWGAVGEACVLTGAEFLVVAAVAGRGGWVAAWHG